MSARPNIIGINATSPQAIARVADAFCDRLFAAHSARIEQDDEYLSAPLKLGEATVDVEYIMVAGCVMVQGATVHDEWVDVDCFATSIGARWRREIEKAKGLGE